VEGIRIVKWVEMRAGENRERKGSIHSPIRPLHLLDDIQAAVHDKGVHVAGLVAEAGDAVAALLRGAEFVLEQRVVFGADYAEVVGHFVVRVCEVGDEVGVNWSQ